MEEGRQVITDYIKVSIVSTLYYNNIDYSSHIILVLH